jgi:ferritin-like metal-binding protein YciE
MNNESEYQSALGQFFSMALQEMLWCENHLVTVLATMAEAASSDQIKEAFHNHRADTETHIDRLEKIFGMMHQPEEPLLCIGLQGLFDEGWQVINDSKVGSAQRDVALIIAAQKVEHYEISSYSSLIMLAKTLGKNEIAEILTETLEEEKQTDQLLSNIAEAGIVQQASVEPTEDEKSTVPSNH